MGCSGVMVWGEREGYHSYCSDNNKDGRTDRNGTVGGGGREQGEEDRGQYRVLSVARHTYQKGTVYN